MKKTIRIIIAMLFWAIAIVVIFFFSDQDGDTSHIESGQVSKKAAEVITSMTESAFSEREVKTVARALEKPIRKCAHLLIYFSLGLILHLALRFVLWGEKHPKLVFLCLFIVFAVACADEINQYYNKDRGSSVADVFLDTIGGAAGIYFYFFVTDLIGHIKNLFKK